MRSATPESGRAAATELVNRFEDQFPAAPSCFTEDLDALLAHLRLPARHRIFCRTANLIERSFEEERRPIRRRARRRRGYQVFGSRPGTGFGALVSPGSGSERVDLHAVPAGELE